LFTHILQLAINITGRFIISLLWPLISLVFVLHCLHLAIFTPGPFASDKLNDSNAVLMFPRTFSIAGAKVKPPTSAPNFVKFANYQLVGP
jgi:hypothetical protein